jgi:hypothetical protein
LSSHCLVKIDSLGIGTRSHPKSQDESPLKLFFVAFRGIFEGVFFGLNQTIENISDLSLMVFAVIVIDQQGIE